MDWLPDAIAAIGAIIEPLGATGLILILATGLIAWAIWWGRKSKRPDNEKSQLVPTVADVSSCVAPDLVPLLKDVLRQNTSAIENQSDIRRTLDALNTRLAVIEDRTRK